MVDLLVKLYDIQNDWSHVSSQAAMGVAIRKPIGPEADLVTEWVKSSFGPEWASETRSAFANRPISCFVALRDQTLIGFACYDATALGLFGPGAVAEGHRGRRTGEALLRSCLLDMRLKGYAYAIIGDAGPTAFYQKTVGAIEIPHSTPGVYQGMLRSKG